MTQRVFFCVLAMLVCPPTLSTAAEKQGRYTAVLTDGRRITGERLFDWGHPEGSPRLDDQPLLNTPTPVRWLSDDTLTVAPAPEAFVEFFNGDCLPGVVVEIRRNAEEASGFTDPDHLLVEPRLVLKDALGKPIERVRVVERMVRRVAWRSPGARRYQPATLFCRDGRKLQFRRHRFLQDAVRVLTESGINEVPYSEIAELHAPQADPWEAYYEEVAALSPALKNRLFQLETTTGLVATSSALRFRVMPYSDRGRPESWFHLIQPAWSLDAFAVGHHEIRVRTYFAPHEVPLSRITPVYSANRSAIHSGWQWQVNRNVHGRPLQSGPYGHGWGFGVHGLTELKFPLPPTARHFRTRLKLDRAVGDGGCVRAVVLWSTRRRGEEIGSERNLRQLYRSDFLMGSKIVLETGNLPLTPPAEGEAALLTLSVDPVYQGQPQGADPLDIRDTLNWLEPTVLLDQEALAAEVRRRSKNLIVPWEGWGLKDADQASFQLFGIWDAMPGRPESFRFAVLPSKPPLVLRRSMTVAPRHKWLIISASRPTAETPASIIEVQVDGTAKAEYEVPVRLSGAEEPRPLVVPLQSPAGRSVRLDIVQRPAEKNATNALVDWRAITLSDRLTMLREMFEDHAAFELLQDDAKQLATAELLDEQAYSGAACIRITPGGRCRIELAEGAAPIREHPKRDEYRYIRFAFRKQGRGHVHLELGHDGRQDLRLRYFAGRGDPADESAKRVWIWSTHADLPDAWIVVTRDLYGDFGRFSGNLTSLSLSCSGGTHVLFDHVYLAGTIEDLELAQAERIATPDQAARAARAAMVQPTLDKALPAAVLLAGDGRTYSGVIVSEDGYVLTAGHTVIGPQRELTVTLADGRSVKGQTLGVDRANDAAMVKITGEGSYPFVKIAKPVEDLRRELLLGVAHQPEFKPGQRPLAHLTWVGDEVDELLCTNFSEPVIGSGGPLLIATNGSPGEGQLVGVHGRYRWGQFVYTPVQRFLENWQRLREGEIWGQWAAGTEPLVGIYTAEDQDVCKISQIVPQGPAEKANLQVGDLIRMLDGRQLASREDLAPLLAQRDPGQEVTLKIERDGKGFDTKLILGGRK